MTGMIERVARALCALDVIDHRLRQQYVDKTWREHIPDARAAIEAMREPGSALLKAGATRSAMKGPPEFQKLNAGAVWKAMLDAALSEGEG